MFDKAAALVIARQEEVYFQYAPVCAFKWSIKGFRFFNAFDMWLLF